jgi:deoxyribonuclease-4
LNGYAGLKHFYHLVWERAYNILHMRRLGLHTSIAGGLHLSLKRAHDLGCNTVQIFSHNPRGWSRKEVNEEEIMLFRDTARSLDISPVFIHASYLINLASPDRDTRRRSISMLAYELKLSDSLRADYLVLHPGRAAGQEIKKAIRLAAEGLKAAYEAAGPRHTGILIENTAGHKGDISSTMAHISEIVNAVPSGCISGLCLDSCHLYAAGYDIASPEGIEIMKGEMERYLSSLVVRLIHLNDSKKGLGSHLDRHEHIGRGEIGLAGFREFLSYPFFEKIPLILETPKDREGNDIKNLESVRRILRDVSLSVE